MAIVGYSPWQDAAQYGQGLGQALTQGLLQLPQQRAEQKIQLGQLQQQQKQQALMNMLAQLKQQQMGQNDQQMNATRHAQQVLDQARSQQIQQQSQNPNKPNHVPLFGPDKSTPIGAFDKTTGTFKLGQQAGLPASPQGGMPMSPSQQAYGRGQNADATSALRSLLAFSAQPGMNTNQPAMYGQVTNGVAKLLPFLLQRLQSGGAGMPQLGGVPPQQAMPQTNAPASSSNNDPLGLGLGQ